MRNLHFTIVLILMALSCFHINVYAESNDTYDVELAEEASDSDIDDLIENPLPNHRMPAHRVICEISREFGVATSLPGFSENIISYEIYDKSGCCVAIFAEESGFINYIFSGISGEFTIRFRTPDIVYSGIITIK